MPPPPLLFAGVDGGQSSTTALIADEDGNILGSGRSGPCNHAGVAEGPMKLRRVLSECLRMACAEAALDSAGVRFEGACFGMSGGPADKQAVVEDVIHAARLAVTDDAVIALSGALGGAAGVVTISGTGSIAFGRNPEGKTARAGGWGYIFGDEGGAFDLVRQALRACLRFEEGWGPATALRDAILSRTGAPNINGALHAFYTAAWPRSKVAALAPLVDELALEGDAVAREILASAAAELAAIGFAARNQLWPLHQTVAFSYIGGVFQSALLREEYQAILARHRGMLSAPMFSAPVGALLEAYRICGIDPPLDKLLRSKF